MKMMMREVNKRGGWSRVVEWENPTSKKDQFKSGRIERDQKKVKQFQLV
jgi:hypothetical protein